MSSSSPRNFKNRIGKVKNVTMNTEILGVVAQIVILLLLSYPLGKYIAKVYKGEKTVLDFMKPVERLM